MELKISCSVVLFWIALFCSSDAIAQNHIALSRVGKHATQTYKIDVKEKASHSVTGEQASSFRVKENGPGKYEVELAPSQKKGFYSATLEIDQAGKKHIYKLHGVATEKFEGSNEPSLYKIFQAIGVKADLGGDQHKYSTKSDKVGSSLNIDNFRVAEGVEQVSVTLVARYSPKGAPEIGFAINGEETLTPIGNLADKSKTVPDAHQRILPAAKKGTASFQGEPNFKIPADKCPEKFGFYYKGKHYTSLTSAGKSKKAKIRHTSRVFKVENFLGRSLKNAYLICYEEATNGDYQDAVILVEGIEPVQP